jgi:hypothetical protein
LLLRAALSGTHWVSDAWEWEPQILGFRGRFNHGVTEVVAILFGELPQGQADAD